MKELFNSTLVDRISKSYTKNNFHILIKRICTYPHIHTHTRTYRYMYYVCTYIHMYMCAVSCVCKHLPVTGKTGFIVSIITFDTKGNYNWYNTVASPKQLLRIAAWSECCSALNTLSQKVCLLTGESCIINTQPEHDTQSFLASPIFPHCSANAPGCYSVSV